MNFRSDNLLFTTFESLYLDYTDRFSTISTWFDDPMSDKLGLLQIYVNDMLFPVISVPMNLAKMINPDTHESINPETDLKDYMMAGKTFLSISSTTSDTNFGVL